MMGLHYFESLSELNEEINRRKSVQEEVVGKLDDWIKRRYRIENFAQKYRNYFGISHGSQTIAVLARQIASVCTEDVACFVGARLLGMKPMVATFFDDSFSTHNSDKRSRVKINWISWSKKGNMVKTYEYLALRQMDRLEGKILRKIETPSSYGKFLPDFHLSLRSKFFGNSDYCIDVSAFHKTLLVEAQNKPAHWYVEDENCRAKLSADVSKIEQALRPPAGWYYPYYLSWFLDGSMVLLETYENPNDEVPEIKDEFVNTMNLIKREVGWYPLVVRTPILSTDMLFMSRHITGRENSLADIENLAKQLDIKNSSLPHIFRSIADIAIAYR